jgi:flagellar biosynthetic protein FliR
MTALPELAGEQVAAFVLVLARVGCLFFFAPVFSSRLIPARAKFVAAGAITVALVPLAGAGVSVPDDPIQIAALAVNEVIIGLAIALALGVVAAAVHAGASIVDAIGGFSFATLVDPFTNMQGSPLAQLYGVFATMVLLLSGGDHVMIQGLARSYDLSPLGTPPDLGQLAKLATEGLVEIFVIGLALVAPVLIALVLTDMALGLVSRAVPQMNVLFVGMPAKIIVVFAVVAASLPFVAARLDVGLDEAMMRALGALSGG